MRTLILFAMLFGLAAGADIPRDNLKDCSDKAAGAPCTTDDGLDGTCVEATSSQDLGCGRTSQFTSGRCEPAKAQAKATHKGSWLVPLLAGVVLGLLLLTRRRFGSSEEGAKA